MFSAVPLIQRHSSLIVNRLRLIEKPFFIIKIKKELHQMRLLQLGFLVALASGFAAILIYITGVSTLCMRSLSAFYLFILMCSILWVCIFILIYCGVDYNRISDEDYEALESLQSGFQKCVVSLWSKYFLWLCNIFLTVALLASEPVDMGL